ncbi:hypothetical protein DHX103_11665 [Planococcus sp. X10-3]|uniref:hypothetical protein n=1 Tax=Planococcus sp. X10-3 TaxID=3061240 RepID=UPI003BB15EFE
MIMKLEETEMVLEEVNFRLLDFVQTADGKWFSIGFLDNANKNTLSKKTAHSMYKQGQIIKISEKIEDSTVLNDINYY